jgi:hypothetical protein
MLKNQDKDGMQNEKLIGPGGAMGHTQAYGVIHYLYDSFIMNISFL